MLKRGQMAMSTWESALKSDRKIQPLHLGKKKENDRNSLKKMVREKQKAERQALG